MRKKRLNKKRKGGVEKIRIYRKERRENNNVCEYIFTIRFDALVI